MTSLIYRICNKCGASLTISERENKLAQALKNRGFSVQQQKCDGHKHIDIVILPLSLKLNVEVDGVTHFVNKSQRNSDYYRDAYSQNKGYDTIRVTNDMIDDIDKLEEVLEYIADIVEKRKWAF